MHSYSDNARLASLSRQFFGVTDRQLLVLVASHTEWLGRSMESVFESNGYGVVRVDDGRRAIELALRTSADALVLDSSMPTMGGIEACRALRADPRFDPTVPIFVTSPGPASNRDRAEAFEAGAWDFCSHPVDTETLLAKLKTYMHARQRSQLVETGAIIDALTGLYTAEGLRQWALKIGARAERRHEPVACVVVAPDASAGEVAAASLGTFCRTQSRASDVVGHLGGNQYAFLAPDTDELGAQLLIDRLRRAQASGPDSVPFKAAYCAFDDFAKAGIKASELMERAVAALGAPSMHLPPPTAGPGSGLPLS